MLNKFFISILAVIILHSSVIAQDTKQDTIPKTKKEEKDTIPGTKGKLDVAPETVKEKKQEKRLYSVGQFARESLLFLEQPARWKGRDYLEVGALVGGTALLTLADTRLRSATQGYQRYYYSWPVVGGKIYGEAYAVATVAGAFGIYGLIKKDTASKKIAIELLQGALFAEGLTSLLKSVVGRARPYMNQGPNSFRPFSFFKVDYNSFPSGHCTSAFALSTVMARHFNSIGLKILAYLPAALTMFSRIYQNEHWVSDELIGAGVGFLVGNWVVDLHEAKRHRINVASVYPMGITIALDDSFRSGKKHY